MYLPDAFRSSDLADLDRLAAHDAFGTLVSQVEGAPYVSHLPVLYRRAGERVTLSGHWARPNLQWRDIEGERVLFIFHGPHGYISPRWYAEPPKNVPTWNYAVAHLYGSVRVIHDLDELERIVSALAAKYESGAPRPWRLEEAIGGRERLRGIVGFELEVEEIQIKLKLNQNHPEANVRGAIEGLREQGSDGAAGVADWMQEVLERR